MGAWPYGTRQWKRLRLVVLHEANFVCGYCGKTRGSGRSRRPGA